MSNKKQLQLHNADLAMALDNINGAADGRGCKARHICVEKVQCPRI